MKAGRKAGKVAARGRAPLKSPKTKNNPGLVSAARTTRAPAKASDKSRPAAARSGGVRVARGAARRAAAAADPALFEPLSEGERADSLRVLTEDRRLGTMSKIARYRVILSEPLVLKPPHELSGRRLAKIVAYDYAADRSVEAVVDLDAGAVAHLLISQTQPALAREEEALAVHVALCDDRIKRELGLNDEPQAAMHYWSRRDSELAYSRRSAAVLFGQPGRRPSLVAVVDLLNKQVTEVVPADQW